MYFVHCLFCREVHASEYWDVVEEAVMRCRDRATPEQRGELGAVMIPGYPIPCEAAVRSIAAVAEERAA